MGAPGLFVLGAGLVCLQGLTTICGTTLQRLARLDHDEAVKNEPAPGPLPVWRRQKFVAGLLLYILAQPLSVLSLSLLPVSVHGPLLCASIIVSSAAVSRFVGERVRTQDYVALGLGVLGACGLLVFGPKQSGHSEADLQLGLDLLTFWRHNGIAWYIPTIAAVLLAALPLALLRTRALPVAHPLCCALLGGTGDCLMKVITMFASQTREFSDAHRGEYVLIIAAYATLGVSNVVMVSKGAQRFDGRYFMPAVMVLFTLQMQLFGLIAYHELDSMGAGRLVLFALFSACCVASVWIGARNPDTRTGRAPTLLSPSTRVSDAVEQGNPYPGGPPPGPLRFPVG